MWIGRLTNSWNNSWSPVLATQTDKQPDISNAERTLPTIWAGLIVKFTAAITSIVKKYENFGRPFTQLSQISENRLISNQPKNNMKFQKKLSTIINSPEFSQQRNTLRFVAWTQTMFISLLLDNWLSLLTGFVVLGRRTSGNARTTRLTTASRDDKTSGDDSSWTLSTINSHDLWSAELFTCNHRCALNWLASVPGEHKHRLTLPYVIKTEDWR